VNALTRSLDRRRALGLVHRALGRSAEVDLAGWVLRSSRLSFDHPGLRIAHLTDLHVGRVTPESRLNAAVEVANALSPDLVCLTGDYVAHSLRYLGRLHRALERLEAPAYAVLGNHDHWNGAEQVIHALEAAGIQVLQNRNLPFEARGHTWRLVGLDDAVTQHHDVPQAFEGESSVPTIVLSHLAEVTHDFALKQPALVLSGHTHGGQVRTGGVVDHVLRRMGHRYILGWYVVDDTPVYVNRGIGAAVFPWRTRHAAPEVACIDLEPAKGTLDTQKPAECYVERRNPFDKAGELEE
jgi:predicted MPP superfamily phosphohydrolase